MQARDLLRRRIEAQGYSGLSDEDLRALDPWLRFTPFLFGLLTALATIAKSPVSLFALAVFSATGALLRRHPFDALYNFVIRPIEGSPRLPPSSGRRRVLYGLHGALVALAALAFLKGHAQAAPTIGWALAAESAWLAAHQISVLSEILARLARPNARA